MAEVQNPKTKIFQTNSAQDRYFTGNPEFSFFKKPYNQYHNFAMELIDVKPEEPHTKLKFHSEKLKLSFIIPRKGDLISHMYFKFKIPEIYSHTVDGKVRDFKWISRLGEYIIDEARFFIGAKEINKLYSEWLHIWTELSLPIERKGGYNKMIGNIGPLTGDITTPKLISDSTDKYIPSIRGRTIIVPLQFWFTYNYALSLPLISLQYEPCRVELDLRPFNDLFTVVENVTNLRTKPLGDDATNFSRFLALKKDATTSYNTDPNLTELEISPHLKINYIFLDNVEREKFAKQQQDYLITDVKRVTKTLKSSTRKHLIDLDFTGPCSKLCWVLRRTDNTANNQWDNFTNWPLKTVEPPGNPNPVFAKNLTGYNPFSADDTININNINSLKNKNICLNARLLFDGKERFQQKSFEFFNYSNNYAHAKAMPEENIYVYSFEIKMDKDNYQPTGYCNFSNFSKIQLELELTEKEGGKDYDYDVFIFAQTYNVLKCISGMGNLEFSN